MSAQIIIGRPINGISLNGDEYLLNDNGEYMIFKDIPNAIKYLKENGHTYWSDEDLRQHYNFKELYPYHKGEKYWIVEELPDEDYEDNISYFQHGIKATQKIWNEESEKLYNDDNLYFDDIDAVLNYARYSNDFIKISCFDCEHEDITDGDVFVSPDFEGSGKFIKSY